MVDLSIPCSARSRSAHAAGFDARLGGRSKWSNPYADLVDEALDEGRRPGWLYSLCSAWWDGWFIADAVVPVVTIEDRRAA